MGGFFFIWTQESRRENCIRFPYIIVIDDTFFIKFLPYFLPVSSTSVLVSWLVVAEIVFVFVFFPYWGVKSGAIGLYRRGVSKECALNSCASSHVNKCVGNWITFVSI